MDVHCFSREGDVNGNTVRGCHVLWIAAVGPNHLDEAT